MFADLVVVLKRPTSDGQSEILQVFDFAILGYLRIFAKIRCARIISVLQYFMQHYGCFFVD